jgi:hypothetical protein
MADYLKTVDMYRKNTMITDFNDRLNLKDKRIAAE